MKTEIIQNRDLGALLSAMAMAGTLTLSTASYGAANVLVDGQVGGENEYGVGSGFAVGLTDDAGNSFGTGGELWVHEDLNSVFFGLVLPFELKDNTWGTFGSDTYSGIDNHTGAPKPTKTQKFQELAGSDKALFQLNDTTGANVGSFQLDFLNGIVSKDVGPFDSGIIVNGPGPGGNGGESFDPGGAVANAVTSGEYNCAKVPSACVKDFSPDAGVFSALDWELLHIYEFEVNKDAFGTGGYSSKDQLVLSQIHLSPKKGAFTNIFVGDVGNQLCDGSSSNNPPASGSTVCASSGGGPTSVPEPASLSLLALGLLGIGGWTRRQRKITA